jgi:hypothetical protein
MIDRLWTWIYRIRVKRNVPWLMGKNIGIVIDNFDTARDLCTQFKESSYHAYPANENPPYCRWYFLLLQELLDMNLPRDTGRTAVGLT